MSCGLCLNDCPTFRILGDEADSPRGRIQLIRELVASPARAGPSLVGHLDACLVCRACETACPSLVPFGRIMEGARELIRERRPPGARGLALRAGLAVLARPRLLRGVAGLADVYARSGVRRLLRRVLPGRLRDMDALLGPAEGRAYRGAERAGADAAMFAGCVMATAFGETDRATVRLLERGGMRVTAPAAQVCCGALHAHSGDGEGARSLARRNVAAFEDGTSTVVVNAAGCGAHLKAYGEVLAEDEAWAARARRFAGRVRDATEAVPPSAVAASVPAPLRVVYQDACHLAHGQRVRRQPRDLLRAVGGVEIVPIADAERCCGSAGIYNLTHPQIAAELQRQKVAAIIATDPDVVVSANPGCILQLRAGLRAAGSTVPVMHLLRFLDDPAARPPP
ncbi:MAG TPA: heterodisulfide reductase-related iron-sulfur binding cluster [Candidatus Limnocylindrales bacterium]|nr:heterodisulfide reductase-related iron-sulfur binding cluster [Candidatus Limnocylindrales bacterium]